MDRQTDTRQTDTRQTDTRQTDTRQTDRQTKSHVRPSKIKLKLDSRVPA